MIPGYPLASYPDFGVGGRSCTLAVPGCPYINPRLGEKFSHPSESQAKIMADAAQQAAAAGADALGTLLKGAVNAVENSQVAEEPPRLASDSARLSCSLAAAAD
eukprot:1803410-Rhodomonas_salina.1